ncbi:MAG: hypothetical protein KKB20_02790, partial [Proteobacteria bacterium]|nr:hypothetical protein [Pseudomonadota bacterium]
MDAERMEPGGESGPPPGLLKRLGRGLLDLLCPRRCLLCGAFFQPDDPPGFCEVCRADMPAMPESRCVHCGRPFDMFVPSTHRCARCLSRPPAYDQALAPGLYEAGLRLAV